MSLRVPRRLLALIVMSALLHLGLLLYWHIQPPVPAPAAPLPALHLRLRDLPPPVAKLEPQVLPAQPASPPPPSPAKPVPAKNIRPAPETKTAAPPSEAKIITSTAAPGPDPAGLSVAPQTAEPSLADRARLNLKEIDKNLREESVGPARMAALGTPGADKLTRGIDKAGINRAPKLETVYGAGGQAYTKYSGPGGTYCLSNSNRPKITNDGTGFDSKAMTTTCPQ